ncbi:uncharacterized protein LOC113755813 [Coffea eugenioides]|uniref:uncharacterized protein LOC113755813 n=1 Tax=Coffea eugenioides TaxID=49369 RepID=UPI000F60EAD4|nr:uncharacterized protein LOC113755813 [Coffea eugenioides]
MLLEENGSEQESRRTWIQRLGQFQQSIAWKADLEIIINPNLLMSKVLKAKYYPNGFIFKCKCPQNASWIWQSLMGVKQHVEDGTWRKIGNGLSTGIWEDKWIVGNRPNHSEEVEYSVSAQNV